MRITSIQGFYDPRGAGSGEEFDREGEEGGGIRGGCCAPVFCGFLELPWGMNVTRCKRKRGN